MAAPELGHLAMKTSTLIAVAITVLSASTVSQLSFGAAQSDACKLVTTAQVSAAVGFTVGDGTHVTPTFVKTCTWSASGGTGVQTVTLLLETGAFFDGAKRQTSFATAAGASVKSAGLGDDSYYLVQGTNVDLWVKKGGTAFKVAVYKQLPVNQKQDLELALAKQVVPKL
jgi:hypothetical protein